ncbi:hypothetical protein [Sporanaerobacter acetigenes]|uniref:hypothetical protein n=1 Tax=Sporanaerobacter acetigenes TaxID=165813 RepID=UPI00104C0A12|nr:hypothetical protein [Sporanaerobacter acetigenes]
MEYTRSMGDYYETFEGTPEEIAELLKLMPDGITEAGVVEIAEGDIDKIVEKIAKQMEEKMNRINCTQLGL